MKKSVHPEWALKHKRKGTELRCIRGRYYLYEVSSKWDKEKKRPKKITGKCLGSITEDGFKPSKRSIAVEKPITVKSYSGCSMFRKESEGWIDALKEYFPDIWKQIYCMACIRLFHRSPIKRMPVHFASSFLSEDFRGLAFSDKKISQVLKEAGKDQNSIDSFMRKFSGSCNVALIDATPIFTKSRNIFEARLGYNNKRQWDPQLNLLYLYDHVSSMPLFYRLLQGDLREIKAMKLTLKASGLDSAIIIGDKGFASESNIEAMKDSGLSYIIPLRRNSSRIDYSALRSGNKKDMDGYFDFKGRYIWYKIVNNDKDRIVIYMDVNLKVCEEKDYLDRVKKYPEEYSDKSFFEKQYRMGTLSLMSNRGEYDPESLYSTYKSRLEIEQMFDVYKNTLDADKTYMQCSEALNGWTFINHLALLVYYRIYKNLQDKKMTSKVSVDDILIQLSHINKIKINDKWMMQEIPTKTEKLMAKCSMFEHIT